MTAYKTKLDESGNRIMSFDFWTYRGPDDLHVARVCRKWGLSFGQKYAIIRDHILGASFIIFVFWLFFTLLFNIPFLFGFDFDPAPGNFGALLGIFPATTFLKKLWDFWVKDEKQALQDAKTLAREYNLTPTIIRKKG